MEDIKIEWDDNDPIFNNSNLEKSKRVFYWYEQQYDAVTAILRNIFEISAELEILDYFAQSDYKYYKDQYDDSFKFEWHLCNNNIQFRICLRKENYVGFWSLFSSSEYRSQSTGGSFLYYTYAKIEDVLYEALGDIKESIDYGNNK